MGSKMLTEALSAPQIIAKQLAENHRPAEELAKILATKNPYSLITVARGSSDHAAQYFNFLAMIKLKKLTTSLSMSAITLYESRLDSSKSAAFAISQSGQSPDLIRPMEYFSKQGSPTMALVNDGNSPLAQACAYALPLLAGKEESVAATKSFIASLSASAQLIAHWSNDKKLLSELEALPENLHKASEQDWSLAIEKLHRAQQIMVVGRGYGLALALECALKFKETCGIQAEAFSSAEIKHGPMALVEKGYPLLIFATPGPAQPGLLELARDFKSKGAEVILAAPKNVKERNIELTSCECEELDILCAIQSFYPMAEKLSRLRGYNPDLPKNLQKVTHSL